MTKLGKKCLACACDLTKRRLRPIAKCPFVRLEKQPRDYFPKTPLEFLGGHLDHLAMGNQTGPYGSVPFFGWINCGLVSGQAKRKSMNAILGGGPNPTRHTHILTCSSRPHSQSFPSEFRHRKAGNPADCLPLAPPVLTMDGFPCLPTHVACREARWCGYIHFLSREPMHIPTVFFRLPLRELHLAIAPGLFQGTLGFLFFPGYPYL